VLVVVNGYISSAKTLTVFCRTGPANTCSWFCKAGDESGLRVFLLESRRSLDVGSVRRTKVLQTRRPLVAAPSNKAGGEHGAASELRDSEPQLTTTPASHTSYDLLLPSTSSSHPPDIAHVFPEAVALGQDTTGSRGETCCHEGC